MQKEWIDLGSDHYSFSEYKQCMRKLFQINCLLGFFRRTVRFLQKSPETHSLLDLGCGDGLFLTNLSRYFSSMHCQGIDIDPAAIDLAKNELSTHLKSYPNAKLSFELQNLEDMQIPTVDVILATLVCHHLKDDELVLFLQNTLKQARQFVVINDLHRHPIAYVFYAAFSPFFRNRLIIHDGLISIKRGFTRQEWKSLLTKSGIQRYEIKWCFPFCWRVILWKESSL